LAEAGQAVNRTRTDDREALGGFHAARNLPATCPPSDSFAVGRRVKSFFGLPADDLLGWQAGRQAGSPRRPVRRLTRIPALPAEAFVNRGLAKRMGLA